MKKILLFLSILISYNAEGQAVINNSYPYNATTYLINNILLGGGVAAVNHSFIGDSNQISFFNGINSNLGIDSGIVLSSGNVFDVTGPNANGSTSTSFFLPGDSTLDAIIFPDPTNDAAILEFDFVPTSDTISFKYVFGSEEYLEWVNSYNDAFGFFLSGPNPAGGSYIDLNLAIIPGTTNTPVTIDNVNDIINSSYYVDNGDGFTPPQNTDSTVIEFDGFTTPLIASASVICGETYHIKLVVADAVDDSYDSGIFLESGSFSSSEPGSISAQVNTTDNLCNGDSTGTASICMQGGTPPFNIDWAGQNPNSLLAGTYIVTITDANGFWLQNSYLIDEPTIIAQNIIYNNGVLNSNANGGTPTYTYSWSFNNIIVGNSNSFSPSQNGDYICIVTDNSGCIDTSEIIPVDNLSTGINKKYSASILVFPNPFNTRTTIKLFNNKDMINNISLFDCTGREIAAVNIKSEDNSIILERGSLAKGIYMLVIKTDSITSNSRLIIN